MSVWVHSVSSGQNQGQMHFVSSGQNQTADRNWLFKKTDNLIAMETRWWIENNNSILTREQKIWRILICY